MTYWTIVWKPDAGGPWRAWGDRVFTSRTAAWDEVLRSRGWVPHGARVMRPYDNVSRSSALACERKRGLRAVPAHIEFWRPETYARARGWS